jgi:hypothetical protein
LPRPAFGIGLVTLGLLLQTPLAWAVCNNNSPTTGQTVTCSTTAPNPDTTGIYIADGNTGVTVNVLPGAEISTDIFAVIHAIEIRADGSTVNNQGSLIINGDGSSGIRQLHPITITSVILARSQPTARPEWVSMKMVQRTIT